jgi:hypothetical protein
MFDKVDDSVTKVVSDLAEKVGELRSLRHQLEQIGQNLSQDQEVAADKVDRKLTILIQARENLQDTMRILQSVGEV